ncbi:MAG: signal recognition particle protein [Actinomycetota bacterium]|nr:signal recognition particle protein [Actinomycetota bacterium]
MFEFLSDKFENLFFKIKNKGKLSPQDLDAALKEIKYALLEADVNFKVVKKLLEEIKEKAIGEKITESLTPYQQVVKIVNDQIVNILGGSTGTINLTNKPPTIIMTVGLQGTGKTSSVVKMANYFKNEHQKKVSVIASDVYRPAAILQLRDMAETIGVEVYSEKGDDPVSISANGVAKFKKEGSDIVIIDTAGRLQIDQKMMTEITNIKHKVKPHQVLLVLDAMTGQEAVNIATAFNAEVDYDGLIMTKIDSDSRGGAALSVHYVTKKPIKFMSTGEKVDDFELFHPDRIASRILGMGDVLTLIENAEKAIDQKSAQRFEQKIRKNELNFEDFIEQLKSVRKMGSMDKIFSMLPIGGKNKILKNINLDDSQLKPIEAMIGSMTVEERRNPMIINGSRKRRIANGSGTSVAEVNRLIKQFAATRQMLKQFSGNMSGMDLPFGKMR